MKQLFRLVSLLGLLVLLQPCATSISAPVQKQPTPNYYPLQVGNTWSYKMTVNGKPSAATNKIIRTEEVDGKKLAVMEASINGKVVGTEYLHQDAAGIFRFRVNGKVVTPPLSLLKYPIKANKKWGSDITVDTEKAKYVAEAREESVHVPAGKYKTIRVEINTEAGNQKINTTYWFAAGVGIVKQTFDLPNLNIVLELEKFEMPK